MEYMETSLGELRQQVLIFPFWNNNLVADLHSSCIGPIFSITVRTLYGDVRGFTVPWHTDDLDWEPAWEEHPPWFTRRVNCFLGIPYASPPIGSQRFLRPEKPRWSGMYWDASYFRPACPQDLTEIRTRIPDYPSANVSEDCLYMNIFAPNVNTKDSSLPFPLPHLDFRRLNIGRT